MAFGKTLKLGKEALDKLGDTKLTEKLKKDFLEKGKKSNKSSTVKDDFEKVVTEGKDGKGKTISFIKKGSNLSKDKQVSKKAENLAKKQKKTKKVKKENVLSKDKQVDKAKQNRKAKQQKSTKSVDKSEKVFSRKEYDKKLFDTLKKNQKNKISKNTTNNKKKSASSTKVSPTGAATSKNILNKQKQSFVKRYKGPIAGAALVAGTSPFLIDKGNVSESKNIGGGNKDKKPLKKLKNIKVKTIKTKPLQQKKKELPKTKSNDYTGRFIDKKGDVAYDSASDFFAHMFGTPKKRAMPKKTSRIIGTGDKLKRKDADKKGAGKGVKFKAFKSGTKDKTIGKPMSPKDALNKKFKDKSAMYKLIMGMTNKKPTRKRTMVEKIFGGGPDEAYNLKKGQIAQGANKQARKEMKKEYPKLMKRITKKSAGKTVGLKDLPPKSKSPGIHKLPAKAKINMGFKPMFGGGFISSLYDKPEKIEKYKGNTTSARQVKGYGKAKKKA